MSHEKRLRRAQVVTAYAGACAAVLVIVSIVEAVSR